MSCTCVCFSWWLSTFLPERTANKSLRSDFTDVRLSADICQLAAKAETVAGMGVSLHRIFSCVTLSTVYSYLQFVVRMKWDLNRKPASRCPRLCANAIFQSSCDFAQHIHKHIVKDVRWFPCHQIHSFILLPRCICQKIFFWISSVIWNLVFFPFSCLSP